MVVCTGQLSVDVPVPCAGSCGCNGGMCRSVQYRRVSWIWTNVVMYIAPRLRLATSSRLPSSLLSVPRTSKAAHAKKSDGKKQIRRAFVTAVVTVLGIQWKRTCISVRPGSASPRAPLWRFIVNCASLKCLFIIIIISSGSCDGPRALKC